MNGGFMIKYRFLLIFCLVFAMSGCAGNKMALTKGKSDIISQKNQLLCFPSEYQINITKTSVRIAESCYLPQSEPNCKHDLPPPTKVLINLIKEKKNISMNIY